MPLAPVLQILELARQHLHLMRRLVAMSISEANERNEPTRFVVRSQFPDGEPLVIDVVGVTERHSRGGKVQVTVGHETFALQTPGRSTQAIIINAAAVVASLWYTLDEKPNQFWTQEELDARASLLRSKSLTQTGRGVADAHSPTQAAGNILLHGESQSSGACAAKER